MLLNAHLLPAASCRRLGSSGCGNLLVHPVQFTFEVYQLLQLARRWQSGLRSRELRLPSLAAGRCQPRVSILVAAIDQHDEESCVCSHRNNDLLIRGESREFLLAGETRIRSDSFPQQNAVIQLAACASETARR